MRAGLASDYAIWHGGQPDAHYSKPAVRQIRHPTPKLVIPAKAGIQKGREGPNCHTIQEQLYPNDNFTPANSGSGI